MWKLLHRVNGLQPLRETFEEYVKAVGLAAIKAIMPQTREEGAEDDDEEGGEEEGEKKGPAKVEKGLVSEEVFVGLC